MVKTAVAQADLDCGLRYLFPVSFAKASSAGVRYGSASEMARSNRLCAIGCGWCSHADGILVAHGRDVEASASATTTADTRNPTNTAATQDERPPTLLDLFKKDFPNMMKASDNEDAYTMHSPDGSTLKIKRQTYMDFDAKTKFVGFYIPMPAPPAIDGSGQNTFIACVELLKMDAVKQTFDHFEKQVAVMGGYGDQMTTLKDLTFSGRVLIYYEEFLPIPKKAEILKAYEAKQLAVTFRGMDYLGTQVIAWHQRHDAKKE